MTLFMVLVAAWIGPGLVAYLLTSLTTGNWGMDDEDVVLFIPVLNIVVLLLTVMIIVDVMIGGRKV